MARQDAGGTADSSRTCAASVFATAREACPPMLAPAPGGALDKVLREAAGAPTGTLNGVADASSSAAASAVAAAADKTKTTAATAASKVAEAASAAASHIPEGLRDVFDNLYSSTKTIADSAGKSVADTAARLASPRYTRGLGVGLAIGGGGGGIGFNMEEALAGLKVGPGAADVATMRQIAGETSALASLLAKLEEEIADARRQRDVAEAAAVLLEDESLCLRDEVRQLENDLQKFYLNPKP